MDRCSHAVGASGDLDPSIIERGVHEIVVLFTVCRGEEIVVVLMVFITTTHCNYREGMEICSIGKLRVRRMREIQIVT